MKQPTKTDPAWSALAEMITGNWKTQAVHVFAALGIPDLLAGGPKSNQQLAKATGAHAPSLFRLMRAATSLGPCLELGGGAFKLAPVGAHLRSNDRDSVRSFAIFWGSVIPGEKRNAIRASGTPE